MDVEEEREAGGEAAVAAHASRCPWPQRAPTAVEWGSLAERGWSTRLGARRFGAAATSEAGGSERLRCKAALHVEGLVSVLS